MGKKTKKGNSNSYLDDVEDVEEAPVEETQPTPAAPAAAEKGKKGGKSGKKGKGSNYWDEEFEKDLAEQPATKQEEPEPETVSKSKGGKKSQKKSNNNIEEVGDADDNEVSVANEVSSAKETSKAQSNGSKSSSKKTKGKESDKSKDSGKNKKVALVALIKKQQEEQRIAAEEEERIRREEEEAEAAEEARRLEEEAEAKAALKKKREIAAQQKAAVAPKNKGPSVKDARFLESLRQRGLLPNEAVEAPKEAPKKGNKKGTKEAKAEPKSEAKDSTPIPTPTPTPAPVAAEPTPETPKAEEDDGNWEDWEDREIEISKEEPKSTPVVEEQKPEKEQKAPKEQTKVEPPKEKSSKKEKHGKRGAKVEEEDKTEPAEKELRSPICCILGHVDTGKTSLLDRIRHTNVQEGEAGGITQQIGATYFPMTTLQEQTASLSEQFNLIVKVPGLLIIDTPGHESFTNLRSRGSGLCDIAILVVDIMHGLEPQTIESINLLRMRKTPFVVALNKVDRIFGWKAIQNSPFRESLKHQTKNAAMEFDTRVKEAIAAFAGQELNAVLYYRNKDFRNYVSLVPTSAHSGEGIPDLLMLLVQLTQKMMAERLYFSPTVQCTVLEVKVVEGHGTTIDVVLVNGRLCEGDTIVLSGMQGPIVTQVRALLTPQPLRELRIKGTYIHHKEIKAAMGIKVVAQDLEKAVAGSALLVADDEDEIDQLKKEVQSDFDSVLKSIDSSSRGVCVQASTLGSLEALLTFLKASKIPVSGVAIGPIHKRDVIRASVMLEHNPEFAVILAFDVKVEKDAQTFADEQGVRIFTADIIYHLFDKFTKYMDELKAKKREEASAIAVWPCVLRIKPECVFNKKDPIVLGVEIVEGTAKIGTPICVPSREFVELGTITSIEHNHKAKQEAKKGDEVAIKIEAANADNSKTFGRHFEVENELVSKISRESINALKQLFGEDLSKTDRQLIVKLKGIFKIQ